MHLVKVTVYKATILLFQLLDFTNCFMTTILDDAKLLSHHARKRTVDVDDVKLAVQMYTEENLTNPTSRDVILETARYYTILLFLFKTTDLFLRVYQKAEIVLQKEIYLLSIKVRIVQH